MEKATKLIHFMKPNLNLNSILRIKEHRIINSHKLEAIIKQKQKYPKLLGAAMLFFLIIFMDYLLDIENIIVSVSVWICFIWLILGILFIGFNYFMAGFTNAENHGLEDYYFILFFPAIPFLLLLKYMSKHEPFCHYFRCVKCHWVSNKVMRSDGYLTDYPKKCDRIAKKFYNLKYLSR